MTNRKVWRRQPVLGLSGCSGTAEAALVFLASSATRIRERTGRTVRIEAATLCEGPGRTQEGERDRVAYLDPEVWLIHQTHGMLQIILR